MADYLAKAPAWSVTVHTAYDAVQPDGFKVERNGMRMVRLRRPDRLRAAIGAAAVALQQKSAVC